MHEVSIAEDADGSFSAGRRERVHIVHGEVAAGVRAPGPLLIGENARIAGDVEARGAVHLARGAQVAGAIRAMGDVILGARSSVSGGVRAEGKVVVHSRASVAGEVDAAGDVRLAPHARVERLKVGGDLHVKAPVIAPKVLVKGHVFVDEP